ncbi:hypothetical protein ACEPAI_10119 [Sanghuangporus weigelae]
MSTTLPPHETFKLTLRKRHLEQLRHVQIPAEPLPGSPWPAPPRAPSPYDQLVQWSEQASTQIAKAVANQAVSPSTVDWNIEMLTFLESAATYLRDTDKVFQAVIEARKNTREADERALQLLEDSQADIKKIAALWGLDFEVICDLLKYSPEGHSWLNGPYGGVFFSKDMKTPFLGLAFKGTNPSDWSEIIVDLDFLMVMSVGNILWGSPIHNGFYLTMFTEFPDIGQAPLDYIKNMIDSFLQLYEVPEGITINLHSTGHSLGAAYATLCYAELMRLYNDTPTDPGFKDDPHADLAHFFSRLKVRQFVLRDLYTFGCPRIGGLMNNVSWAKSYKAALDNHNGQSWRIQNNLDPVTAVPPVLPLISTWNHVDNGYQVNDSSPPQALPTEIDTQPGVSFHPGNISYHSTEAYFKNIYNASTTGLKIKIDLIQQFLDEASPAPTES